MKNMFKNAYFGKAYKTRDNKKALFLGKDDYLPAYLLFVDDCMMLSDYDVNGVPLDINNMPCPKSNLCIISEWQEEITEEELDKLAEESYPY